MNNKECFTKNMPKLIVICSIIIAAISTYILLNNDLSNKPLAGQGGAIEDSALIGGDFILTDQDGNKFNSEKMQDRITLIYFGFTYCPDVCPTSLQKLNVIIDSLQKYRIDVLPIFISVDPQRDTPEVLKKYLSHFNKKIIGLTGDEATIKEVANLYKVYYEFAHTPEELDGGTYMIDHTSFLYVMGKNRQYVKHFYLTDSAEDIIEYIRVNHKSF